MNFSYRFPAVKGYQAGREYYIAMIPLRFLERLFGNDDEYVPPEYRAQRRLNTTRIPVIKEYIVDNRDTYVFSALAASIDGEYKYLPSDVSEDIGILEIDMASRFMIIDGQHRKASIIEAIAEDETLANETISIVFYEDKGLERSQQMFTDLNKHAVKTSNSIAELYDNRDPLAVITRNVISSIEFLDQYTDKEKDILGKFSSNFFTLNAFYKANKLILKNASIDASAENFLQEYWSLISENITPWKELMEKSISKVDLREQYIITQVIVIQAFGVLGNYFYRNPDDKLDKYAEKLKKIDWSRNNKVWKQRVIRSNGTIINSATAAHLACNIIKKELGLPLESEDKSYEKKFKEG